MKASPRTGGATAFPRLEPRPPYPPASEVVPRFIVSFLRFTLLTAIFGVASRPAFEFLHTTFEQHLLPLLEGRFHGHPSDVLFAIGLTLAVNTTYTVVNGFFAVCDRWKLLQHYKLARTAAQEPSPELVAATLRKEAFAHFVTAPIIMIFIAGPFFRWSNPAAADVDALPSFSKLWPTIVTCHAINDVWFYFGHRLLHSPVLYKAIHKRHHSYVGTRSFAAEYAHEVEDVFTAYIPYLLGLFVTGAHFHTVNVWFMCRLCETYEAHSGYCFHGSLPQRCGLTFSRYAAHHDFHHTGNRGSFGNEFLDWLCGTDDAWYAMGGHDSYIAKKAPPPQRGATDVDSESPPPRRAGKSPARARARRRDAFPVSL